MSELPAGWRWQLLGELLEPVHGKHVLQQGWSPQCLPHPRQDTKKWAILKTTAVQVQGFQPEHHKQLPETLAPRPELEVRPDDLLLTCAGPRARCGIPSLVLSRPERLMISGKMYRFRPQASLMDARFLFRYLTSPQAQRLIDTMKTGISDSGLNLTKARFAGLHVPVPPLDEQHRIVAVLEGHLSRLDAARDYVDAAARRTDSWRRATIDEAVAQSGPESCTLADLVDRIEAGRSFGGSAPPARDDEWGVVRVSAMTWGEFRPQENKAVPEAAVDPRYEIRPGDLLVSRANTTEYVGAPVLVGATRPRLLLSDKSLRLVPRKGVNPRWLVEVLGTRASRRQVSALATGTKDSMRNISQANLLSVAVPSPPKQQRRMIESVSEIHDKSSRMQGGLTATSQRASTLRRRVLAAAMAGQL